MYNSVKIRIRCGYKLTDYTKCTVGVKQGDVCSPILFYLFINEFTLVAIKKKKKKVGTVHHLPMIILKLFILFLADDVVLLSETAVGLQTQLNSLQMEFSCSK